MVNDGLEIIDLRAMLNRVFKHYWIILASLVVSFVCFSTYAFIVPPKYLVETKFVYRSATNTGTSSLALSMLSGGQLSLGNEPSQYIGDVLKSSDLLIRLVDVEWVTSSANPIFLGKNISLFDLWGISVDTTKPNFQDYQRNQLINIIKNGERIRLNKDAITGVLTLSVEIEDPRIAYDISLFLLKELNSSLVRIMSNKAAANRKFIEERLSEVKKDLANAENNLKHYRARNRLRLDPNDQLEDARLQREVLINQEVMIQLQKQYEMAKIEEAKDLPVLDVIDSPRIPVEKSKPQRKKIVLVGLVLGLILGALAALGYDYWQESRQKQS